MAVNLSLFAGVGAQFFDNNGVPLAGGLIYTYLAGTNTPAVTYTSSAGTIAHANPIVLNSAGRVATGEVWLPNNTLYKFVLYTSASVLIATYDNVTGVGDGSGIVSLYDYGAVGDGVTNDTVAVQNAEAYIPIYAPSGTFLTTIANPTELSGRQWGSGQIKTADGNKSAPYFSVISSPPTSVGNQGSILTAFNGDISKIQFAVGHVIKGANTLTQPTSGYYLSFETAAFYTQLSNTSGHNQSTTNPDGRTGTSAFMTKVTNAGQGDVGCYFGLAFVTGTKAGSTNFLANPAGGLFGGQMNAGADGVYLNAYEVNLQDNGYDVACVGTVNNLNRTNNTGAKNVFWAGYLAQSTGTKASDSAFIPNGKWNNGLDLVNADFGTNKSAISLKEDQRIYFNNFATPTGGSGFAWVTNNYNNDYIKYGQGIDVGIQTYVNGVQSFTVRSDVVSVNNINGVILRNTGILRFQGTGQANTGTSTPSFTATNKPGSTNGQDPATWLRIVVSGTEYVIPCWLP